MLLDLTPDDLADDAALRRAAIRLAPTTPYTVDRVYAWLCVLARAKSALAWEPPGATRLADWTALLAKAQAPAHPEPDYRRGLRRPWWERR